MGRLGSLIACMLLAGCSPGQTSQATLYRNAMIGSERILFATFNSDESDAAFNINNCQLAARVLNANVVAQSDGQSQSVGFWCEPGDYSKTGPIPLVFDAEYPTN